jgi:hypothetical protein
MGKLKEEIRDLFIWERTFCPYCKTDLRSEKAKFKWYQLWWFPSIDCPACHMEVFFIWSGINEGTWVKTNIRKSAFRFFTITLALAFLIIIVVILLCIKGWIQ